MKIYQIKLIKSILLILIACLQIQAIAQEDCKFAECNTENTKVLAARIAGSTSQEEPLTIGADPYLWVQISVPTGNKWREGFYFRGDLYADYGLGMQPLSGGFREDCLKVDGTKCGSVPCFL